MRPSSNVRKLLSIMLCCGMLAGCLPSPTLVYQSTPFDIRSPVLTQIPTPNPVVPDSQNYQLTYISECGDDAQCVFEIDVNCLNTDHPCLGEPQILFKFSGSNMVPTPPITSYSWSPDGKQIAITATGLKGNTDIFLGELASNEWINLTKSPFYEDFPVWSPDGKRVAFSANSGEPNFFVLPYAITPDGKSIEPLLNAPYMSLNDIMSVSWSPDGKQLAFAHADDQGFWQLYLANLDGSSLRQLTSQKVDHFDPQFSPDGRWLLYRKEPKKGAYISYLSLIPLDGNENVEKDVIRDDLGWRANQKWSFDGNWIAYMEITTGSYDIFLIRSDGKGKTIVANSDLNESLPMWKKK